MTSRKWAGLVFPVTLVVGVPSLARATAPPDGFVLLETITVPTDGSSVASTHILQAGVTYKIRALGLFSIGGAGYGYGDAEYAFDGLNGAGNVSDTNIPPEVDLGIAINDTVNDIPKFPSWGSFNPSHVYTIDFAGLGAPISLNYHDSLYPDNAFPATVEISQTTWTTWTDSSGRRETKTPACLFSSSGTAPEGSLRLRTSSSIRMRSPA
jgi:hypothetical protein